MEVCDDDDFQAILDDSNAVINAVNAGVQTAQESSNLSTSDALALLTPIKELKKRAQELDDELKARINEVKTAKACDIARDQLAKLVTGGTDLGNALVSNVPTAVKGIALQQADGFTAILKDAEATLAEDKCINDS